MPSQVLTSVENNFTKGLVTEFTGMNFPENAATDTDNCTYEIVGNVTRREGINQEANALTSLPFVANYARSEYKWDNAGGDGVTQLIVRQQGNGLYFYRSSSVTTADSLSYWKVSPSIELLNYVAPGVTFDRTLECQYASGNGYLFVYHPSCTPIYVTYIPGGPATAYPINVRIRDFNGTVDSLPNDSRPSALSTEHQYNLINQGWTKGSAWDVNSASSVTAGLGAQSFFIGGGVAGVVNGQQVRILYVTGGNIVASLNTAIMAGTVTGYGGGILSINVTTVTPGYSGQTGTGWRIQPINTAYIDAWFSAVGNYPSNSDVWWYYKNVSGVFDPATTNSNVTLSAGRAPQGHVLLDAFNQQRSSASGVNGLTSVTTTLRPRTGCWFQGRVWYTGVDAVQPVTGDVAQYSWSENIYFSQIIVDVSQFGNCYQTNDPTSANLFDLLPSDGGVISIQGTGRIFKLFPITNGLLVFATNGIWFITGNRGIGFTANDYTITKLSAVQSISSTSFVDVNGLPYFWNEEGIYAVQPTQTGSLEVNPITVGTILSFYNKIPLSSKKYVRAAYHPIDYVIQWVYRDTEATNVTSRYQFNKILNFNTYNKAFYPYTVDTSQCSINGIVYVSYVGGVNTPSPSFKYPCTTPSGLTFAQEFDTNHVDWATPIPGGITYKSYFITGYKLHGQGQRRFQIPYILMYSNNDVPNAYKIQGQWDYAISGDSGKWSTAQLVNNFNPNFGVIFRRHRIRGRGLILQIKLSSSSNMPFNIIGWSTFEAQNMSV